MAQIAYHIPKRKSSLMIFQIFVNMEFAHSNHKGYYVDTVGENAKNRSKKDELEEPLKFNNINQL